MDGRLLAQRVRIGGIALAGGLLAGMSLCALGVDLHPAASVVNRDRDVRFSSQVQDILPAPKGVSTQIAPKCTKSVSVAISKVDEPPPDPDPMGTIGSGLNCTGAPRRSCAYAY
jgi:hypothetical protein